VPADRARGLFERLWSLAPRFNASMYGLEALQSLRIEKGYIHIGTDTDGTTQPGDVGYGRGIAAKQANFVGRRSLMRSGSQSAERPQLVGLVSADRRTVLPVGGHLANNPPPTCSEGHVTSSTQSVELGYPISLAMLNRGAARTGERIGVHHLGTMTEAEVVALPFIDPTGARLRG
jgi:sarcosine oxidase, subunit alpha